MQQTSTLGDSVLIAFMATIEKIDFTTAAICAILSRVGSLLLDNDSYLCRTLIASPWMFHSYPAASRVIFASEQ